MLHKTKYCNWIIPLLVILVSCLPEGKQDTVEVKKPNIIYILADDLGYGDVLIYNPQSKIKTPNIDKLAAEGMRFTDAHSPSSVCTPTRYGILTGRYCWRSKLPQGVLRGYGQALLDKDRTTVASLLKENGYTTGVIGKWHLGLDWVVKEEFRDSINIETADMNQFGMVAQMNGDWIDYSKKPTDGPLNHGFDYSFILPASLDMEPYCYLENDVLTEQPDQYTPGNDLNTGSYATGAFWRPGRITQSFDFYDVLPNFIRQAKEFVKSHAKDEHPFFLYLPLAAPHSPWVPTKDHDGDSGAGQYGDFVQMVDNQVGQILQSLKDNGFEENTLVVFTSDNGGYWRTEFIEKYEHRSNFTFRGMKSDIWEGGHHIPFMVKWPGKVKAGTTSKQVISLTDFFDSIQSLFEKSDDNKPEDSFSFLSIAQGKEENNKRAPVIHHSGQGRFGIRDGDWKYIAGLGSGGFTEPSDIEPVPGGPKGQLYNLNTDPQETENLYLALPEKVTEMEGKLKEIRGY